MDGDIPVRLVPMLHSHAMNRYSLHGCEALASAALAETASQLIVIWGT